MDDDEKYKRLIWRGATVNRLATITGINGKISCPECGETRTYLEPQPSSLLRDNKEWKIDLSIDSVSNWCYRHWKERHEDLLFEFILLGDVEIKKAETIPNYFYTRGRYRL